jgi:hypothetical protein
MVLTLGGNLKYQLIHEVLVLGMGGNLKPHLIHEVNLSQFIPYCRVMVGLQYKYNVI